tara:strand:- start:156 stop:689 length:534 start_codon:yes stop_codon:yes gene_type:complete
MEAITIDKNSNITSTTIKNDDIEYLSKKCSFKNSKNFDKRTTWNVKLHDNKFKVILFSKNDGRANNENKYDFPPPVDKELYFGTIILVNYDENNKINNLSIELWNKIYEKLFGGFEDLSSSCKEDEQEEDELEEIDDSFKTKEGYLKDGFVIDDNEDSDVSFDSELSEEDYVYSDEG